MRELFKEIKHNLASRDPSRENDTYQQVMSDEDLFEEYLSGFNRLIREGVVKVSMQSKETPCGMRPKEAVQLLRRQVSLRSYAVYALPPEIFRAIPDKYLVRFPSMESIYMFHDVSEEVARRFPFDVVLNEPRAEAICDRIKLLLSVAESEWEGVFSQEDLVHLPVAFLGETMKILTVKQVEAMNPGTLKKLSEQKDWEDRLLETGDLEPQKIKELEGLKTALLAELPFDTIAVVAGVETKILVKMGVHNLIDPKVDVSVFREVAHRPELLELFVNEEAEWVNILLRMSLPLIGAIQELDRKTLLAFGLKNLSSLPGGEKIARIEFLTQHAKPSSVAEVGGEFLAKLSEGQTVILFEKVKPSIRKMFKPEEWGKMPPEFIGWIVLRQGERRFWKIPGIAQELAKNEQGPEAWDALINERLPRDLQVF